MGSKASQQLSYIAPALAETESGSGPPRAEIDLPGIRLNRSTLLISLIKEIVGSNRGRLALLVCCDLFAVIVSVKTGYAMSPSYHFEGTDHLVQFGEICLLGLSIILSGLSFGLYERPNGEGQVSLLVRSAAAACMAWALVLLCEYTLTREPTGRWIVVISTTTVVWITLSGRLILRYVQKRMPLHVVVLGDDEIAESIRLYSARRPYPPLQVEAVSVESCDMALKFLAYVNDPMNTNVKGQINWVVLQGSCEGSLLERLLPFFRNGTRICDVPMFFEGLFQKVPVEFIDTNWLIQANVSLVMMASRLIKRAADALGALIGLLVTLPLWPAISLAIKLSDKGPVLYRQERVGRHGKVFRVFKFRTMHVEAESSGKAIWASRKDSRVTLVGRFLRKTRLDEIPQFINVLLGQMSLVGPRPERPEFVEELLNKVPHYKLRHLVRPGITGWAQINYRYAASLEDSIEKLRYHLYYVKYGGVLLDLQIIIRTVGVMMRGSR